jgi:hypothetical protein
MSCIHWNPARHPEMSGKVQFPALFLPINYKLRTTSYLLKYVQTHGSTQEIAARPDPDALDPASSPVLSDASRGVFW